MTDTTLYVEAQREWRLLENWRGTSPMAGAALRLHEPEENAGRVICRECSETACSAVTWPCRTYTAIEQAARA